MDSLVSSTFTIPREYPYVLGAVLATCPIAVYHMLLTGRCRKAAQIPYPNCYATPEEAKASPAKHRFNCAQRAHAQFTENHLPFVVSTLIAGLKLPLVASGMGAAWCVGRVLYAYGYTRADGPDGQADPKNRSMGVWWYVPHTANFLMAAYSVVALALEA